MLKSILYRLICLFFSATVMTAMAQRNSKLCYVAAKPYPGKDPVMWDALYAAKNGAVYSGLITEGVSAHLYVYLPSKKENHLLFDIAEFEEERGKGIRTSGKLHNKPVEDREGNIYFVPLNNGSGPRNIDYTSWVGGHWMKYSPASGKLENLGLVDQGIGCYPITIDKDNKYIYGVGFTGYFYRFDLTTHTTTNFGRVSNWDVCREIFSDDNGNVYGSFPTGRIWKYDARQQKLFDLSIQIPYDPTIYPVQLINPMIDRTCDWRAIAWDSVGKVAYGVTTGSGSILFKYDPHWGTEGKVTLITKMCDDDFLKSDKKNIPYSTLAFAMDTKNRKIYFVPSSRKYDLQHFTETFASLEPSHLVMYDMTTEKRVDLGMLVTMDGRKVLGCEGATVDGEGTLFICGLTEVNAGDATSHIGNTPVALQLFIYKLPMVQKQ